MLGMTSTFSSDEHTRIGGEIGAFIDRLSKRAGRDFGVIRYESLGVFCIIEYLSPNRDVFIDILNLGNSLANFNRAKADQLEQRLFAPLTCDGTSEALAAADSDYHHMRQDWNAEEHERLEKVARGE
jgi:hypothetical protein